MAALPADVAFLMENAIDNNFTSHVAIPCQFYNKLIYITINTLAQYIANPEYTGQEIINYRGIQIATWFNRNTCIFEGEIRFKNHQLDILAKQDHSLFKNVYYKYILQKNDIKADANIINVDATPGKTFKLRCYVREFLIQSVDTLLNILHTLPVDETQLKFIASHFQ